jgi:hypothetical protein
MAPFMLLWLPIFMLGEFESLGPGVAVMLILALVLTGLSVGSLARQARKVLKAGHTLEDTRLALELDVTRLSEELRFQVGDKATTFERVALAVTVGGLVFGGVAIAGFGAVSSRGALVGLGSAGILMGVLMASFGRARYRMRGNFAGKRLLKVWSGRLGDWVFKLAGFRLKDAAPVGIGAYRPTEMAIGLAANKLFEDLPKETRRELAGLPETVQKLEEDVRALRLQVKELNSVLAEIGDDPAAPGGEAREKVRSDVEATRDAAAARLRDAVTALEQVRLGLIRIHAGEQVLPSVTMELKSAKDLSEDMANLLEGHREVERLLAERRATGMFTIVEE